MQPTKKNKKASPVEKEYVKRVGKLFWKARTDYSKYNSESGYYKTAYFLHMVAALHKPYGRYQYTVTELTKPEEYYYHSGQFQVGAAEFEKYRFFPVDPKDPMISPDSPDYFMNQPCQEKK